ncbi:OsmC family peroxiredoxin [Nocardioides sp. QY071]|uniref:OsmC family peroxiredoxin n=1 Tax=Nocardioides sp. QY071 TaxID=3044187 RepID=UPI00249C3F2B|nr:OsmC family peroxiredoxin [Nocardioides sp. QY071]WGY00908.1 OsmC family peroxiredoxin [Nocardioides sp. QY071]
MADPSPFGVRVSSGTLRAGEGVVLPHAWTEEGVLAGPATNGAQVLHLAVALCVLNDTYREARRLDVPVLGVAVTADGGFDDVWTSTGIGYDIALDTTAPSETVQLLLEVVDEVAEIPRALRAGADVRRMLT